MKSRFASFSEELPSPLSLFGLAYNTDNGGRDLLEPYEHASALIIHQKLTFSPAASCSLYRKTKSLQLSTPLTDSDHAQS